MSENNNNNQDDNNDKNNTPTEIKLAAQDPAQRASAGQGFADPGPGDPSAAPSAVPELVDIPPAPSPSQLVVKSTTLKELSASKGINTIASPGASVGPNSGAISGAGVSVGPDVSGGPRSGAATNQGPGISAGPGMSAGPGLSAGPDIITGPHSGSGANVGASAGVSAGPRSGGGISGGPRSGGSIGGGARSGGGISAGPRSGGSMDSGHRSGASAGVSAGSRSGAGAGASGGLSRSPSASASPSFNASSQHHHGHHHHSHHQHDDGKKKKTHFRYHKRVTVNTKGKTNPNSIMDKVNYKDHEAGITPSAIEEMDPQELMDRAGIKNVKKGTHWRVRLRQTERITKNGKTVTQTKVAYRDSEGNKKIKTSKTPNCEKCGKPLEECSCDSSTK